PAADPPNPWPLFPDQTIREPTPGERSAPPVKDTAGFWRRAGAFSLDLFLLNWLTIFFIWIGATAEDLALAASFESDLAEPLLELASQYNRISSVLFLGYFSFFTYYGGQTPGKLAWRIRVVTTTGLPLTLLRTVGRTFAYYLSFFTFGLGFLMAAIPPAKRALHDVVAGTEVVRIRQK
ncbi:MAG TPA: RDD family protein, partial [Nitrospiria bacterium]